MAIDERHDLALADFPSLRATGSKWRAGCPVHGSDHQRSVRIHPATGHWKCHVADCGAWGYITDLKQPQSSGRSRSRATEPPPKPPRPDVSPERRRELAEALDRARAAFPGSAAETYLEERGIAPALAAEYGAGFVPSWDGWPRVVFPLYDPDGITALYGRAIDTTDQRAPRAACHRITDGAKGYFNLPNVADTPNVTLTEGVLDALSVVAAGVLNVVAIIGADDFRPDWLRCQKALTFALDNDAAGRAATDKAAPIALSWGFRVTLVDLDGYGEHKDINAYWVATGSLPWAMPTDEAVHEHAEDLPLPDEPAADDWPADVLDDVLDTVIEDEEPPRWHAKVLTFHYEPAWIRNCRAAGLDVDQWREKIDVAPEPGDPHAEALELQRLWHDLGEPPVHGPWGEAIHDLAGWMRRNGPETWDSIRWSLSIWEKQRDCPRDAGNLAG